MEEYLNVASAARYLDCSEEKIRKLIKDGVLECTRDELNYRLILKSDLDKIKIPSGMKKCINPDVARCYYGF